MNLMKGLIDELNRNKALLKLYNSISQAGMFGLIKIRQDIEAGEKAIENMDTIEMIKIYGKLHNNV